MKNAYKEKMDFHFKEFQLSVVSKKEKSAAHHLKEYLYFQEKYDRTADPITDPP